MKTWNQRLSQALAESEEYQGNANRFAGDVGASAPSVAAWIGAGNIRPARDIRAVHLLEACRLLHVRPEWILFGTGPKNADSIRVNAIGDDVANVSDPNVEKVIRGLIKRLQAISQEVQEIISEAKCLPSEQNSGKTSHDMSISSIRRDVEAQRKLAESVLRGDEKHGRGRHSRSKS